MLVDKDNREIIFSEEDLKAILRRLQSKGTNTLVLKDDNDKYVNIEKITFKSNKD